MPDPADLLGLDPSLIDAALGGNTGQDMTTPSDTGVANDTALRALDRQIADTNKKLAMVEREREDAMKAAVAKGDDPQVAALLYDARLNSINAQLRKDQAQRETVRKNLAAEEAKAASAGKYGFSSAGKKILRTNPITGEVSVAYEDTTPDKVGASSESQANARQAREQELQRWIHEQDQAIRKGDIDARVAKSNFDNQMEFLKWAVPKDLKYRPGFEPGGPIARSYAAAGQSYDPESPQNRIMGVVDPFAAAQQQGTPFGTYGGPAPQPAPAPMPPPSPTPFAAAQAAPQGPPPAARPVAAPNTAFAAAQQPWFQPGPGEQNPAPPPWYDPNDPYGGMG